MELLEVGSIVMRVRIPIPWGSFLVLVGTGLLLKMIESITYEENSKAVRGIVAVIGLVAAIVVGYRQLDSWGYF